MRRENQTLLNRQINAAPKAISEPFSVPNEASEVVRQVRNQIEQNLRTKPGWFDYYSQNHSARIAYDLDMVERLVNLNESIIEFGSSPLLLTAAMAARGFNVTGVDLDPQRFEEAAVALGLNVVKCDIESDPLPFNDNSFEVAIFNEIFEHLRIDIPATFTEIHRVMKPGGRLLLSTPNGRSYANLCNLIFRDRGLDTGVYETFESLRIAGHMGHVREYTVGDVTDFLGKVGFHCDTVVYRGRYPTNFGQVIARLFPKFRPFFSIVATRR